MRPYPGLADPKLRPRPAGRARPRFEGTLPRVGDDNESEGVSSKRLKSRLCVHYVACICRRSLHRLSHQRSRPNERHFTRRPLHLQSECGPREAGIKHRAVALRQMSGGAAAWGSVSQCVFGEIAAGKFGSARDGFLIGFNLYTPILCRLNC